jgi:hypothetical protein
VLRLEPDNAADCWASEMLSVASGEAVVRVQLMAKVHICTNTSGHAQWVN